MKEVANGHTLIAHILRSKIGKDKYDEQSVKKVSAYYYMKASPEVIHNLKDKPQYLEVETTQKNYATITNSTRMKYIATQNMIDRKVNNTEVVMPI